MNSRPYQLALLLGGVLILGAGCTRHISRDISPEGVPDDVIFPDADDARPNGGTHPSLEALRTVRPGINKDSLYTLLGVPHHREAHGAREWDYLFNLPRNGEMIRCQYKVIFDKEMHGQNFFWNPASCAELLKEPAAAVAQSPQQPQPQRFELSGDALFAFGRSGLQDILPKGREQLAEIAQQLQQSASQRITVGGHTDLIGSDEDNLGLSQRRADTVREYLISLGVPASAIAAQGHGESEPVKTCDEDLPRAALVACLQPNRRVEITGWAEK